MNARQRRKLIRHAAREVAKAHGRKDLPPTTFASAKVYRNTQLQNVFVRRRHVCMQSRRANHIFGYLQTLQAQRPFEDVLAARAWALGKKEKRS